MVDLNIVMQLDENGNYEYAVLGHGTMKFMMTHTTETFLKHYYPIVTAEDLLAQKYRSIYSCQTLCERFDVPYLMFDVMCGTKNTAPLKGTDEFKIWDGTNKIDQQFYNHINHNNYMEQDYWSYIFDPSNIERGVKLNGGHANETGLQYGQKN